VPVEIKELHIRVTVSGKPSEPVRTAKGGEGKGADASGRDRDEIVAECVEQVLQILQAKRER
jgi:hypothetical protein